jgi:hypothetical protein
MAVFGFHPDDRKKPKLIGYATLNKDSSNSGLPSYLLM